MLDVFGLIINSSMTSLEVFSELLKESDPDKLLSGDVEKSQMKTY